ncbi:MAG: ParA family protein [Bacteroidales bacterium]|jgi:chromosome partitioning protein|nr:ParA family protein [Bacteroidales bacterium]
MKQKVIGIMGQKGGAGKSTLTNIIPNEILFKYSKRKKDCKILVLDVDTQRSNSDLRERDVDILKMEIPSPFYDGLDKDDQEQVRLMRTKFQFLNAKYGWKPYELKTVEMEPNSINRGIEILNSDGYDFVFLDFPGTLDQEGTGDLIEYVQYMFIPTAKNTYDINSLTRFIEQINDIKWERLESIVFFFNKFEKIKDRQYNKVQTEIVQRFGYPFMRNRINKTSIVESDYYNSLLPMSLNINLNTQEVYPLAGVNFSQFTDELLEIVNHNNKA